MDDLISRQDAIEYLMTNMNWYDEDERESDEDYKRECITDLINGVPSAQPVDKDINVSANDTIYRQDLVDRRAVLHIIGNAFDDSAAFMSADYVRIRRQVEALPTLGQWTPCSKKLLKNTKGDRMSNPIDRQAAIQTAERMYKRCDTGSIEDYHDLLIEALTALPSAQPNLDEWCRDCKEYDKERHSCPRWNRVIRQTVEDLKAEQPERKKGRWNDIDSETYAWKIRCDQCGHERSMLSTGQTYPRFCENCGADMRGKGD